MHIILTGATGFVGGEVLSQLLHHPSVTRITALSRKPLPEAAENPKLNTIILADFTQYPPEALSQLSDADACIWTLGSADIARSRAEESRRINLDFTLAGASAFATHLAPSTLERTNHKFRFVYTSGAMTERDPNTSLWFASDFRKMRGEVENRLIQLEAENKDTMEVIITKPGGITPKNGGILQGVLSALVPLINIQVDQLAAAQIEMALNGSGQQTWEGRELTEKGKRDLVAAE